VFNNQDLNQVTWEQRALAGEPKFPGAQHIPDVPYAEFAKLLGFTGIRCDDPRKIGAAWDEALATRGPVVLEAVVDPEIPPTPPYDDTTQAGYLAPVPRQDDPPAEDGDGATKGARQKMHEFTASVKEKMPGSGD